MPQKSQAIDNQSKSDEPAAKGEQRAGSKILETILNEVEIEQDIAASWSQNWNAHSNHSNNRA